MTKELKNTTSALLDKAVVTDFEIISVKDYSKLQKEGIIIVKEAQEKYRFLHNGQPFSYIKIPQNSLFDDFYYGINEHGNYYEKMDLSVPDDGFHNLNCVSADYYKQQIRDIKEFLFTQYGMVVSLAKTKYERLEINKTIELDDEFENYQRPLLLLMHSFPKILHLKNENLFLDMNNHICKTSGDGTPIDFFCRHSFENIAGKKQRGISVKIYNKAHELMCKFDIHISGRYLRFEIVLHSPKKIEDKLSTNSVWGLTDQNVNDFFHMFIKDNVQTPFEGKATEKRLAEMKRLLTNSYVPGSHTWVHDTLLKLSSLETGSRHGLPLLLDIEELIPLIDTLPFGSRQIKCNTKRRFREVAKRDKTPFVNHDKEKYEDLIEKLL